MEIKYKKNNNVLTFYIYGELDEYSAEYVRISLDDQLRPSNMGKKKLVLDFSNVDIMTTAFLNNAIGKLYKTFDKQQLNKLISMQNISDSDLILIKKVIERAKLTFTDELKEEFGDE